MFKKIVCVGMMALMMVSFTGCGFKAKDMIKFPIDSWSRAMSAWPGFPIKLKHSDENAIFECTVDKGLLLINDKTLTFIDFVDQLNSSVTVKSDNMIGWAPYEKENEEIKDIRIENAFIEIILKIDEKIIGYAVVEIYDTYPEASPEYPTFSCKAKLLKAVLSKKAKGEYQSINEEEVKIAIEKIKTK